MLRRSILLALTLALFGATIGLAVAALRPRSATTALAAQSSLAEGGDEPHWDVERIDPLPSVGPLDLPSPAAPAEPKPRPVIDLAAAQRRLTELKYYGGQIDGVGGGGTRSAVMAFQKVNGLRADGSIGAATLAALESPAFPNLRGGPGRRVEVDLSRQVLYYVEGGELARIMPVSSGNGASYEREDGSVARSLTPVGTFKVQRTISGVREADLGTLYDPMYFYQGWAIHGSNSVPAYPASHGCVRVTRTDALWLFDRLPVGTTVMLYGGTHTFTPGSSAPGTTTPAGDGPIDPPPDNAVEEVEVEEPEVEEPAAVEPSEPSEPSQPDVHADGDSDDDDEDDSDAEEPHEDEVAEG
ncbi:MAG: L,D-transpeptidase family protein [Egibacteraceae bacterium]